MEGTPEHDPRAGGGIRSHAICISAHDVKVGADHGCEIGFVDDEQVAFGNCWATFSGDFFTRCHIDDVDGEVAQLWAEGGR